jgi:type II secretory pathway pseudopilin PulG
MAKVKTKSCQRGFTIVELLVVMGIIMVLVGLLVPTITRIRVAQKAVACEGNVRTLTQAIFAFAVDNDGRLPGNSSSAASSSVAIPSQRDFLFGSYGYGASDIGFTPQSGTLFPYVNNYQAYLCPAQSAFVGAGGTTTASFASNGRFDYTIFGVWSGARLSGIAPTSHMTWPDGHFDTLATPILVQEAPDQVDVGNMEGCHSNIDLLSHAHFNGSYYGAVDGSAQFVIESPSCSAGVGTWCWTSKGPSTGKMQSMAAGNVSWGYWDTQ